jgi:hypothetical protein
MHIVLFRPARRLAVGVLTGGMLALACAPGAGHAMVVGCRADPIVAISNGTQVQLYSDIGDASANVQQAAYVLHGPHGTTMVSVSYPSDGTASIPETFIYVADQAVSSYKSYATIYDANRGVSVVTYTVATNTANTKVQSQSVSSVANQTLSTLVVFVNK